MKKTILLIGYFLVLCTTVSAQNIIGPSFKSRPSVKQPLPTLNTNATTTRLQRTASTPCFYKRKSEWQHIIDSTWGPGASLSQKLAEFDYVSNYIKSYNPTFGYTHLNWDSVSAYWRARINDSTSEGGFATMMNRFVRELKDGHAYAWDNVLVQTPLNPGTPILVNLPYDGFWNPGPVSHFGAGLEPLPDSTLLVYKVLPNHPLGLEPGDIVLGYEGIPWKDLYCELMAGGIPYMGVTGSAPTSSWFHPLKCAGMNWHLFDTIDVVKYKSGQTLHLALGTMSSWHPTTSIVDGGQLPVAGVSTPSWAYVDGNITTDAVTYGIVNGTNIGYIYVYHHSNDNVGAMFDNAVNALSQTHGLIIDIRFDMGGWVQLNQGIGRLTTYGGPTVEWLTRSSPSDPYSLHPVTYLDYNIPQDNLCYQYPIAVLVDPTCWSDGDITAHQLTYLPNVRFFGRSPMGIYGGYWYNLVAYASVAGFTFWCPVFTVVDQHSPSTQLWGKDFPVDEQVWLTPDNVAKGQDDVVMRALQWIQTLTFAHDAALDRHYARPGKDSVCITAQLTDPLHHTALVSAIVADAAGAVRDSVLLYNDGLHGDGAAGDSVWGSRIIAPSDEGVFNVSVRTDDSTKGTFRRFPNATTFTTAGALKYAGIQILYYGDTVLAPGATVYMDIGLKNMGTKAVIPAVTGYLTAIDSGDIVYQTQLSWGSISPDTVVYSSLYFIRFWSGRHVGSTASFALDIHSKGVKFWQDTIRIVMTTGVEATKNLLPASYSLDQNYPNPFNPSTTLRYGLPARSRMKLTIYNILGQVVTELVNTEQVAGWNQVVWNANVASGLYFYRLEAVSVSDQGKRFVDVKKMLLLK